MREFLVQDLLEAAGRISEQKLWCQGHEGLSKFGTPVSATARVCERRDALGACRALARDARGRLNRVRRMERYLQSASYELYGKEVSYVNDGLGGASYEGAYGMVTQVFKKAVETAERHEQAGEVV